MPHAHTSIAPRLTLDDDALRLSGDWLLRHSKDIEPMLAQVDAPLRRIDVRRVSDLDTYGVLQLMHFGSGRGLPLDALQFDPSHADLVAVIEEVVDDRPRRRRDLGFRAMLERVGKAVVENAGEFVALVGFFGEVLSKLLRMTKEPHRLRPVSVVHHMEQVGLDAVPLVVVLSYLVGAVIAFLGANVLQEFGATIFVVELVSIAFLREFGVLLTAIVLAGRTASAFTAQIGSMKSREEVDAMRTIGLDPVDTLVIPRVLALLLTLPLLTFLSMMAGLLGGLTVGAVSLDIPPQGYLSRMEQTMEARHFFTGLAKAPVFALVIALIGCLEGLQVEGTAQSVGERTTSSVVQSIAMVIVLDAFFALWFMNMGF